MFGERKKTRRSKAAAAAVPAGPSAALSKNGLWACVRTRRGCALGLKESRSIHHGAGVAEQDWWSVSARPSTICVDVVQVVGRKADGAQASSTDGNRRNAAPSKTSSAILVSALLFRVRSVLA